MATDIGQFRARNRIEKNDHGEVRPPAPDFGVAFPPIHDRHLDIEQHGIGPGPRLAVMMGALVAILVIAELLHSWIEVPARAKLRAALGRLVPAA